MNNKDIYKGKTKIMKIKRKQNPFSLFYKALSEGLQVFLQLFAAVLAITLMLPAIGYISLQVLHNVFGLSWTFLINGAFGYDDCFFYGFITVIISPMLLMIIWFLGCILINAIIESIYVFVASIRAARLPLTIEEIEKGNFQSVWDIAGFIRYMTTYNFLKEEKNIYISEDIVQELCKSVFEFCKQKQSVQENKLMTFTQSDFTLEEKSNILNAFRNICAATINNSQLTSLLRIEYFLSRISKTYSCEIITESFERHVFEKDTAFDILFRKEVLIYKTDSAKKSKCTFLILQDRNSSMCKIKIIRK